MDDKKLASSFSLGANLPWINYGGDFGANAWRPEGGLGASGVPAEVRSRVNELRRRGVATVRWFVFCDGRAGIRFDSTGEPLGLDDYVMRDLDAALAFASEADVSLVPTLFDFLWCRPLNVVAGVQTGGRAAVLADSRQRAALLERVIAPVLERYGRHPAVGAWDVMNEPEWVVRATGKSAMREFIRDVAALVHRMASQPVTVGLASVRGLGLARDAGLDFYQVHWYDRLGWLVRLSRPVHRLGLDRPVVLGEFPTAGSRRTPDEILRTAREAGYAGAWFWSVYSDDKASNYGAALEALASSL